jgi:hypothetical protein
MTLEGESLVRDFFTEVSPMTVVARISLTYLYDSISHSGRCGNSGNVLFHYSGFSSSSFEFVDV